MAFQLLELGLCVARPAWCQRCLGKVSKRGNDSTLRGISDDDHSLVPENVSSSSLLTLAMLEHCLDFLCADVALLSALVAVGGAPIRKFRSGN